MIKKGIIKDRCCVCGQKSSTSVCYDCLKQDWDDTFFIYSISGAFNDERQ